MAVILFFSMANPIIKDKLLHKMKRNGNHRKKVIRMNRYDPLISLCGLCAENCYQCYRNCLDELHCEKKKHCLKLLMDCAMICELTATMVALSSEFLRDQIRLCARVCERCKEECEQEAEMYCKTCAEACTRCFHECNHVLALLS